MDKHIDRLAACCSLHVTSWQNHQSFFFFSFFARRQNHQSSSVLAGLDEQDIGRNILERVVILISNKKLVVS
jgi:hypothetical protein